MKILNISEARENGQEMIKFSMNEVLKPTVQNNLDACSCTGNGGCQ